MSESGDTRAGADDEIDDPGRDPRGLEPPRNPMDIVPGQDSGEYEPQGSAEPSDVPESPDDDRA